LTELLIFYVALSYHEGVDEATIVEVLAKRTNAQRQQIKAAYQQSTGKVSIFTPSNNMSLASIWCNGEIGGMNGGKCNVLRLSFHRSLLFLIEI